MRPVMIPTAIRALAPSQTGNPSGRFSSPNRAAIAGDAETRRRSSTRLEVLTSHDIKPQLFRRQLFRSKWVGAVRDATRSMTSSWRNSAGRVDRQH
jgi:hypothetical protein